MKRVTLLLSLLLASSLLVAGCTADSKASSSITIEPVAAAPESAPSPAPTRKLVFDMGHREIFGPDDTSELGQSQAIDHMRNAGFEVTVNQDAITAEDLQGASGLMLAGPMIPLQDAEYETITAFAESGGVVLLTIHVPYPVLKVPAHWGLPVEPAIMMSERPYEGADPTVFPATDIKKSRLTEGVDALAVVSGWPVTTATKQAEYVIKTDDAAWVDVNQNGTRDEGEGGPFGVVGATRVGDGFIIVIGDDAVFANMAIGQPGNARLLDNILEMMRGSLDV